ncbi:MAG: hypothetical protein ACLGIB_03455 [Actinomycetota bacterium]
MPSALRSRLALFALLGAFLIPIAMSSLRGLTHVLTCKESAETPFTLITPEGMEPQLLSSSRITADTEEYLCGGLSLNMGARSQGPGKVDMILPITNHSEYLWQGTVTLVVGDTTIPADIGKIPAGETRTDTLELTLDPGELEVNGSLLIGP